MREDQEVYLMSKQIEKVQNGAEKAETYKAMTGRHKVAMKHGFWYEAMLIDYAILEDRLSAFLWAAGVIAEPEDPFIKALKSY